MRNLIATYVEKILKDNKLWDETGSNWKLVGAIDENHDIQNHSIIGNQQSSPSRALVEKLVNCGDSALMLLCQQKNIDPKSNEAPNSTSEAIENLFGIREGKWLNAEGEKTRELADKFCKLVVTGERGSGAKPCYTIIDEAEGQSPKDFNTTFLSTTLQNKVKISFVQGKFGMGSHGALPFCGNGLELIISKRNPEIEYSDWGFTVVRKIEPEGGYKSSRWVYLTINDEIPAFKSESLDIVPTSYPNPYGGQLNHGTFIKLYDYDIGPALRSNARFDLYFEINKLLVNPVVPVKILERRENFKGSEEQHIYVYGLSHRLEKDQEDVVEKSFPTDINFVVEGQKFIGSIYAFKRTDNNTNKKINTFASIFFYNQWSSHWFFKAKLFYYQGT